MIKRGKMQARMGQPNATQAPAGTRGTRASRSSTALFTGRCRTRRRNSVNVGADLAPQSSWSGYRRRRSGCSGWVARELATHDKRIRSSLFQRSVSSLARENQMLSLKPENGRSRRRTEVDWIDRDVRFPGIHKKISFRRGTGFRVSGRWGPAIRAGLACGIVKLKLDLAGSRKRPRLVFGQIVPLAYTLPLSCAF